MVWHEDLWATMGKFNINASIIRAIENLYDNAQSAVLFHGSTSEWFQHYSRSSTRVSTLNNPL